LGEGGDLGYRKFQAQVMVQKKAKNSLKKGRVSKVKWGGRERRPKGLLNKSTTTVHCWVCGGWRRMEYMICSRRGVHNGVVGKLGVGDQEERYRRGGIPLIIKPP